MIAYLSVMHLSPQVDTHCTGRIPKNISVKLNNTDTFETISSPSCPLWKSTVDCENKVLTSQAKTKLSISVNLTEYLETHNHYAATVVLKNIGGEIESSKFDFSTFLQCHQKNLSINILCNDHDVYTPAGTFHVQNISMTKIRNNHCVTCMFAQGSTASGCHIRFMDATLADREVLATDAHRIHHDSPLAYICEEGELPPGLFRVLASDISSSGMVDDRVAAVGSSLITILKITTLTATLTTSSQQ